MTRLRTRDCGFNGRIRFPVEKKNLILSTCQNRHLGTLAPHSVSITRGPYLGHVGWSITSILLSFRGPCIVIYSYNKNQRDALFLKFIFVKNSTCFGQIYCPSSGVLILYSQQEVFVIQVMLTVC
jgi:hypothetical protein